MLNDPANVKHFFVLIEPADWLAYNLDFNTMSEEKYSIFSQTKILFEKKEKGVERSGFF